MDGGVSTAASTTSKSKKSDQVTRSSKEKKKKLQVQVLLGDISLHSILVSSTSMPVGHFFAERQPSVRSII